MYFGDTHISSLRSYQHPKTHHRTQIHFPLPTRNPTDLTPPLTFTHSQYPPLPSILQESNEMIKDHEEVLQSMTE